MSDDWGYIGARIRAMRSRLLSTADFERMMSAGGLDEIIGLLDATPYGAEIRTSLTATKGIAGFDEGLRRNLEKTFDTISGMTSDHARELVGLILGRWEIFNVKTILRGKHGGVSSETILATVLPFGDLDDVALAELAAQSDVRGVVDLLGQWGRPYARQLRKEFAVYREKEDLQALEQALDRSYFAGAFSRLDPNHPDDAQVIELLRREIDVIMIGYALRIVHHREPSAEPAAAFINGGKLVNAALFARMVKARDMDELIALVTVPCFAKCLQDGLIRYLETRRLSVMERNLEGCFIRNVCAGIAGKDPLSASLTISYVWMKLNELQNLRIISRGKQTGMPADEIRKYLVFTGSTAS